MFFFVFKKIQYNGKNEQIKPQNVVNIKVKNVFNFIGNYGQGGKRSSSLNSTVKTTKPYMVKTITEKSKKLSLPVVHEKKLKVKFTYVS